MSDTRNELLLVALHRAGRPMASDDLLDAAHGLALNEGWSPAQVAPLTRKSVAKRLQNMVGSGQLKVAGAAMDEASRRTTPTYVPATGYDLRAVVPEPPRIANPAPTTAYDGMDRTQLLAVLEAHDDVVECVGRFFADLTSVREKVRRRLLAAGLGTR
jgi:hypothetical protein